MKNNLKIKPNAHQNIHFLCLVGLNLLIIYFKNVFKFKKLGFKAIITLFFDITLIAYFGISSFQFSSLCNNLLS